MPMPCRKGTLCFSKLKRGLAFQFKLVLFDFVLLEDFHLDTDRDVLVTFTFVYSWSL